MSRSMSSSRLLPVTPSGTTVGVSYLTVDSQLYSTRRSVALEPSSVYSSICSTTTVPSLISSPSALKRYFPSPWSTQLIRPKLDPPVCFGIPSGVGYSTIESSSTHPRFSRNATTSRPHRLLASLKAGLPGLAAVHSETNTGPFVQRVHANYVLQKQDPHLESVIGQYYRSPTTLSEKEVSIEHIVQATQGEGGGSAGKVWKEKHDWSLQKLEWARTSVQAEMKLEKGLRETWGAAVKPVGWAGQITSGRSSYQQTDDRLRRAWRASKNRVGRYQRMVAALEEEVAYYRYRWQSAVLLHCREDGRWLGEELLGYPGGDLSHSLDSIRSTSNAKYIGGAPPPKLNDLDSVVFASSTDTWA